MSGKVIEEAHRRAAEATGRLSLMLSVKRISTAGVKQTISDLTLALEELRKILPK